jgi:hypothetical protein
VYMVYMVYNCVYYCMLYVYIHVTCTLPAIRVAVVEHKGI